MDEIREYVAANVPRPFTPLARSPLPSLNQLCESPFDYLTLDIAALNVLCASGLPHSENIGIEHYYDWMEEAAHVADFNMRRHLYRFNGSPSTYNVSQGYFCCYHLLQTLQEEFGVRYNPARVRDAKFQDPKCLDPDFKDSRDLFIHGIIDGPGGTCASMPVLYTAVGRILGYPLKLVLTRGHLFFRWDDSQGTRFGYPDVFNVEGTGEGIHAYPDEFYRTWPEPWSDNEMVNGCYLKSLSPAEELALFLSKRAECLIDNRRFHEALQAYNAACILAPDDVRYEVHRRKAEQLSRMQVEFDGWRMEEDRKRRMKHLEGTDTEMTAEPSVPPHGAHCLCPKCWAANAQKFPPHSECCTCKACSDARKPPVPPHGDGCQCMECRRARQNAQAFQRNPHHPPGCMCGQCHRPGQPFQQFGGMTPPPIFDPFSAHRTPQR